MMCRLFTLALIFCIVFSYSTAQSPLKLDYITKIPTALKNCGAFYTYDTTALTKKKFILAVDFQNKGLIMVAGKQVALLLNDTKLVNKTINVLTYLGSGYNVVLSTRTVKQTAKLDTEEGTLEITKGKNRLSMKIHGQSGCDPSKEEAN